MSLFESNKKRKTNKIYIFDTYDHIERKIKWH